MMHKYLLHVASKAVLLHAKQAERGGRWLTPALQESVVSAMPWLLYPQQRPSTHFTGGWVDLRGGLYGSRKSRPSGVQTPNHPARIK